MVLALVHAADVFEVWTGLLRALAAVLLTSALLLTRRRPAARRGGGVYPRNRERGLRPGAAHVPAARRRVPAGLGEAARRRRRCFVICELGAGRRGRRVRRRVPR